MSTSTETMDTQQTLRSFVIGGEEHILPAADDSQFQSVARGNRQGTLKLRGIPSFSDPLQQRQWMKEHMAAAFRYFGKMGYAEGVSGHISMRDPILKDHFWMNPFAKHFSMIKASDLVLLDSEGYVAEGGAQLPINEAGFMIHSEIHKARPDVVAAAHTHGVYGKTWSAFGKPIEMLTQDACNFYGRLSVYDDHGGVALSREEGRQIAQALGKDSIACILQNHGLLTVGRTVDEAAILYSMLDNACHAQLMAEAAAANGIPKRMINDDIAKYTAEFAQNPHNLYTEFQPEYELIVEESNGRVLQ
ncbi:Meiotically protein [Penicillium diatomitis]|uniref:Meiotically protein n=1 Tax=Penicillium diatomitis TaxID=2819901 RepID=A0A9W9XI11_9EURO|nr:Meiotically protein [Penicillium diatomitis]KAJ5492990.1 Meiotically protein [Penicillium diatomitis]